MSSKEKNSVLCTCFVATWSKVPAASLVEVWVRKGREGSCDWKRRKEFEEFYTKFKSWAAAARFSAFADDGGTFAGGNLRERVLSAMKCSLQVAQSTLGGAGFEGSPRAWGSRREKVVRERVVCGFREGICERVESRNRKRQTGLKEKTVIALGRKGRERGREPLSAQATFGWSTAASLVFQLPFFCHLFQRS